MKHLKRILHVEDDTDILEIAKLALQTVGGFELLQFTLGTDTVENMGDFTPDLFLLDVMMPGIGGIETLELLHQIKGFETVPAVFMTAKTLDEATQKTGLGTYVIGTIEKPFDTLELPTTIHRFWQSYQTEASKSVA